MNYPDQAKFLLGLREVLGARQYHFAGAQFRIACIRDPHPRFLTGCALFLENHVRSREAQDYGSIVMAEEWIADEEASLGKLQAIVNGHGSIEGYSIADSFSQTDLNRKLWVPHRDWTGWQFASRQSNNPQIYLTQSPLINFELRPYQSAAEAIGKWVHDEHPKYPHIYGNTAPYQHQFITWVPDTRARVLRAEWLPGILRLELEFGISTAQINLQVLFAGGTKEYRKVVTPNTSLECEIPDGTRRITILLVHESNDCISQITLNGLYELYGDVREQVVVAKQTETDLNGGENDHVEFKPWIASKSPKENEVIETLIAFANTSGGRLYFGVDDRGVPVGDQELSKTFKLEAMDAVKQQIAQVKNLVREKIKPVPDVTVEEREVFGERTVVAETSQGKNRPYSTHDNKAYIRKGSTNRLIDLQSELPLLTSNALDLSEL